MKHWLRGTWAVLRKDLRLELRSRYVLNALLVFVLSALLVVALAAGADSVDTRIQAGLLWIVILFTASLGLGRAFVVEEECNTALLLRLHTTGSMVYTGKLAYSFLSVLTVNGVLVMAFLVLLSVEVAHAGLLVVTLALGTLGLSGATTLLAAIIARTARSGPLLPMLLFPLLMPLLLAAVEATHLSLTGSVAGAWNAAASALAAMTGFTGVVISASVLLFDHVWHD